MNALRKSDADLLEMQATVMRWRSDPIAFVREVLKAEPDNWQREALEAYATHDRISIRSGHGVGKSTLFSWIILHYVHTHFPCKVPVTGSNFDQLKATLWSEVQSWLRKMPQAMQNEWDVTTEGMKLKAAPEESFVALRTASPERAQNLAGFHSQNVLVVVDEASAVADLIFEVLQGALTTAGAKLVMAGNPTQVSGTFYNSHHVNRDIYKCLHVNCEDSARVSPAWVQEQENLYGRDSNVFAVRVLGNFPSEDDDGVIPLSLVESAVDRDVQARDVAPIWGVDPARFGDDRSTLARRQGNVLLGPVQWWRGKDTEELAGLVYDAYIGTPADLRPSHICVDTIGIGAGVYDKLVRDQRIKAGIVSVNVAESPSRRGDYPRLRDQLWFDMRDWFGHRDVRLPKDDALVGELTVPRYTYVGGKRKVESKDEMKKRGVRSPDLAEALLMTFAAHEQSSKQSGLFRSGPVMAHTAFNAFGV